MKNVCRYVNGTSYVIQVAQVTLAVREKIHCAGHIKKYFQTLNQLLTIKFLENEIK